jgi:hypothetical protein
MKNLIAILVGFATFAVTLSADDRPISFDKLPSPAKVYIQTNFPGENTSFVAKDDDIAFAEYTVIMMNGTKLEFSHSGALSKISSGNGIPAELIPESIREYVKAHYPGAGFVEFDIDRRTYEVKLTNRMELKFNNNFHLIAVDD